MSDLINAIEIIADSARGQYIPKYAAECLSAEWVGLSEETREILKVGPEHDFYWETWETVLNNAEYTDENGNTWRLLHDGDLWAYCDELMTDEEYYNFYGEKKKIVYTYTIDLNERGIFSASVYDENGKWVLSIDASFFEYGWMKHEEDINGLLDYLNDTLDLNVTEIEID